jgi:hypothetical protein
MRLDDKARVDAPYQKYGRAHTYTCDCVIMRSSSTASESRLVVQIHYQGPVRRGFENLEKLEYGGAGPLA